MIPALAKFLLDKNSWINEDAEDNFLKHFKLNLNNVGKPLDLI